MTATVTPLTRMVRSLPAAAHIRALRHLGVTNHTVAARARIANHQLRRAFRGEPIGWEVERRILALPIDNEVPLYEEKSSLGARRRLRALHALGWPLDDLAAALDWPVHKVGNILAEKPIPVIEHLMVCALYDQRWTWMPEDHGIPADDAEQARLTAQLAHCYSPLAWDDETIDNPKGRPVKGNRPEVRGLDPAAALRALDGERVELSPHTRTHAIAYGARYLDMPFDVIAERLGMEYLAVKRSWERIKQRERASAKGTRSWVDEPRFTEDALRLGWAPSAYAAAERPPLHLTDQPADDTAA